jgi:hypothetical protein
MSTVKTAPNVRSTVRARLEEAKPNATPPGFEIGDGGLITTGDASPNELSSVELTLVSTGGGAAAAPALAPPSEQEMASVTASTWVNNQHVNALWCNNQNRNSWQGVAGIGWKKFANNSDTASMAFTTLAANARQSQGLVSYREEADGMVHEIYVW